MTTFRHRETLAVRWGDMDAFGHVNNAAFFTYCESARISYFEAIELDRWREDENGSSVVVLVDYSAGKAIPPEAPKERIRSFDGLPGSSAA
jgi:acyl-CoA thioester hydrolase